MQQISIRMCENGYGMEIRAQNNLMMQMTCIRTNVRKISIGETVSQNFSN